jgi:hypothetical protein|tara:strand:+ start:410 stop:874 length:465 start_codon:yes stop_codon:yes gene_type:complete
MFRRIITLLLLIFVSSCGYNAIYSKKNLVNNDFSISKLSFVGNRDINLRLKEKLNNLTLIEKNKGFELQIFSIEKKEILAKNISGDPMSFKTTMIIEVKVLMENKLKNNLQIVEDFNYNNDDNKFNLKTYEKQIRNNLADNATGKLIQKLSNIQ